MLHRLAIRGRGLVRVPVLRSHVALRFAGTNLGGTAATVTATTENTVDDISKTHNVDESRFWRKKIKGKRGQHYLQIAVAFSLFVSLFAIPVAWSAAKAKVPRIHNDSLHQAEVARQGHAFKVCCLASSVFL